MNRIFNGFRMKPLKLHPPVGGKVVTTYNKLEYFD